MVLVFEWVTKNKIPKHLRVSIFKILTGTLSPTLENQDFLVSVEFFLKYHFISELCLYRNEKK